MTQMEATNEEHEAIQYLAEHCLSEIRIDAPTDTYEWETALDEDHKRAHLSAWEAALKDPDAPAGVRQVAQVQVDRWESVCQGEAASAGNPVNTMLTEDEVAALVSIGLVQDASPRPGGGYPDGTRLWLTERGRNVFGPMVDHAGELDFHLADEARADLEDAPEAQA